MNGGRQTEGLLIGFGPLMNLVLDDSIEIIKKKDDNSNEITKQKKIGTVFIRGKSVEMLEPRDTI